MPSEQGSTRLRTVGPDEIIDEPAPAAPGISRQELAALAQEIDGRAEQVSAREAAVISREQRATQMITVGLMTLGKQFVIAVSNLFSLIALGAVFWLWYEISGAPDQLKLWSGGAFSTFVVVLEYIRRRK